MVNEFDKDYLSDITKDIDWDKIPPKISRLVNSPTLYLFLVVNSMEKLLRENLAGSDLTNTQFRLLMSLIILSNNGDTVTQNDLTNFLKTDKTMVSEVLRTLEKKGYIVRKSHPRDGRAKSLAVTDTGMDIIDKAINRTVRFNDTFFSPLGEEKDEFIRLLKKLL